VQRWTAAIAHSRGFVFVTPEYNYGASAVLKNGIDWVCPEWNRKAAAFVSLRLRDGRRRRPAAQSNGDRGSAGPIRSSVHIPVTTLWAHYTGGDVEAGLADPEPPARAMIDDLLWCTAALQATRASAG
jgi:hypothetical protein